MGLKVGSMSLKVHSMRFECEQYWLDNGSMVSVGSAFWVLKVVIWV